MPTPRPSGKGKVRFSNNNNSPPKYASKQRIEANEDTYNLTERLQADFSWLDKADGVSGSIPNTQDAYSPDKQLTNDLYLLKRFGNKFIIFTSYTFLQDHPQRMNVVYGNEARTQRIEQRKLFSDNKIDYGFVIGQVMVSLAAGAKVMWRDMDSELEGITITDNDEGKSSMNYTQLYLTPKLEYRTLGHRPFGRNHQPSAQRRLFLSGLSDGLLPHTDERLSGVWAEH